MNFGFAPFGQLAYGQLPPAVPPSPPPDPNTLRKPLYTQATTTPGAGYPANFWKGQTGGYPGG